MLRSLLAELGVFAEKGLRRLFLDPLAKPGRDLASVGLRSVSSRLRPGVSLVTCDRQWALAMPLLTRQTAVLRGHCLWLCKDAVCEEKGFGLAVMVQDREPLDTHSFDVVEKFLRPSASLSGPGPTAAPKT